jgi:beta-glucosidase
MNRFLRQAWLPSSPLRAFKTQFPVAKISYVSGDKLEEASEAAKITDVAIVFAYVWESEGFDLKTLDLPEEQNKLIETVAAANPRTIVVLETGSPATMPWVDKVAGVIEAWYPGIRGAEALASIVAGTVNPSGKLAITFPKSDSDLPHPNPVMPPPQSERRFPGPGGNVTEFMSTMAKGLPPFQVYYDEKLKVGYKWYDAEKKAVLFPFGFGLSYTTFGYSELSVSSGEAPSVAFTVKNMGSRAGSEIAEVYCSLPAAAGEPPKRLVGWSRVELGPGESKQVTAAVSHDRLSVYDEASDNWKMVPGAYTFMVGGSSQDLPLRKDITLR